MQTKINQKLVRASQNKCSTSIRNGLLQQHPNLEVLADGRGHGGALGLGGGRVAHPGRHLQLLLVVHVEFGQRPPLGPLQRV